MRTHASKVVAWMAMLGLLVCDHGLTHADDIHESQNRQRVVTGAARYPLVTMEKPSAAAQDRTGVFDDVTLPAGGRERHYRMVVPANYRRGRPIGILLGFQGFGEPRTNHLWSTGFEDKAESAYWITVSVSVAQYGGYDYHDLEVDKNEDLQLVESILTRLHQSYAIDDDRVFACGFSNGANFSQCVARSLTGRIAAIDLNMGTLALEPAEGAAYACIAAGGTLDAEYKSSEYNRTLLKLYEKHGMEMVCHEFTTGHQWPQADTAGDTPREWTDVVTEFFMQHPRGYRERMNANAPRQGAFREVFAAQPKPFNSRLWHLEAIDQSGVVIDGGVGAGHSAGQSGEFATDSINTPGKVHEEKGALLLDGPPHSAGGLMCYTQAVARPARWSVTFSLPSVGAPSEFYPIILRQATGQVASLSIDEGRWAWRRCPTNLQFRKENDGKSTATLTLAEGALKLKAGNKYTLDFTMGDEAHWQLLDAEGKTMAESALPKELTLACAEFGFGVRGEGARVRIEAAELSVPISPELKRIQEKLLGDYLTTLARW